MLAGGEGTRLRPLTYTVPKAVMPLAGRPFLSYTLDWLRAHGVDDVVMSCGFMSAEVRLVLGDIYQGMRLRYVVEDEPLGTAGPVRLAHDQGILEDRVVIANGDVLTDLDLSAEIAWHEEVGAQATLGLVKVEDTASYGVVPTDENGRVEEFREKSDEASPHGINAGVYVLERSVAEGIPADRAVSFEREVFPALVDEGVLYGHLAADPYWKDIGTPARYLEATWDLLAGTVPSTLPARDVTGSIVAADALVSGAHVGPQSVLGRGCSVSTDARVERSVLFDRVVVGADAWVRESVLAERVRVGEAANVGPGALLGAGVSVGAGASVGEGARLEPGVEIAPGATVDPGAVVDGGARAG